jgi:hypothetical protein
MQIAIPEIQSHPPLMPFPHALLQVLRLVQNCPLLFKGDASTMFLNPQNCELKKSVFLIKHPALVILFQQYKTN